MLTVRNQDIDIMLGLHVLKADDYITKPFWKKRPGRKSQKAGTSVKSLSINPETDIIPDNFISLLPYALIRLRQLFSRRKSS